MLASHIQELRYSLKLTIPLMVSLLIQTSFWLINGLMMASLGPDALAAAALVITSYYLIIVLFFGFTTAVGIHIGQARGAQDQSGIVMYWQQGAYVTLLSGLLMMVVIWNLPHLFVLLQQRPELIELSRQFTDGIAWGSVAVLGFTLFRELYGNLESPLVPMCFYIAAVVPSILLNYGFIHGAFGLPVLGMYGIGLANTIVQWAMFIGITLYSLWQQRIRFYIRQPMQGVHWPTLATLVKLGFPISLTNFFEAGLFNVSAIIMGWISIITLAAHQILLQYTEIMFMCFFAIAQTAAIRIAHSIGKKQFADIKTIAVVNASLSLFLSAIISCVYWFFPASLTWVFVGAHEQDSQELYALTRQFFHISTVFILFDGLQIIGNMVLRSMKDTWIPMVAGLGSYWIVGVGAAYWLGFVRHMDGYGVWLGLTLGVTASALALWARFAYLMAYPSASMRG